MSERRGGIGNGGAKRQKVAKKTKGEVHQELQYELSLMKLRLDGIMDAPLEERAGIISGLVLNLANAQSISDELGEMLKTKPRVQEPVKRYAVIMKGNGVLGGEISMRKGPEVKEEK
jgi:hypothetical protein